MKYLFLDFDGVLHGEQYNWQLFSHMDKLCEAIIAHKDNLRIVISSSWREDYSLETLKEPFWEEVRPLIVGITPSHEESFAPLARFGEIKHYCQNNNISDNDWIALDDMAILFPEECQNLILTNSLTGLSDDNILRLLAHMETKPTMKCVG